MSPTDLLDIAISLPIFVIGGYLARRKPAPGRVTFVLSMVFGLCLSIIVCRGKLHLSYWNGIILGLIITPPFYLSWARTQLFEESWAHHHDHKGRMSTRSKTFTIPGSLEDEPKHE